MYRALTEPQLVAGCERTSFFALLGVCLLLGFVGGVSAGRWLNVALALLLFVTGKLGLGHLAKKDPQLREVAVKSYGYRRHLPAVRPITPDREGGARGG